MLKSRLCGCIAGETPAAFVRIAKAAKEKGVGLVELRLDYLKTAAGLEKAIRAMRSLGLDIIAINRLKKDGGRFSGSERRRTALLLTAMQQAGWWYSIFGGKVGCIVEFMKLTVNPHAQDGTRWIGATNPDVTAAAVGAACRALAAEKGTNHVGQEKA